MISPGSSGSQSVPSGRTTRCRVNTVPRPTDSGRFTACSAGLSEEMPPSSVMP